MLIIFIYPFVIRAEAVYQSMKSSFGSTSCHLLQINSATQSAQSTNAEEPNGTIMPDPWSQFLPKYCVQNVSFSSYFCLHMFMK